MAKTKNDVKDSVNPLIKYKYVVSISGDDNYYRHYFNDKHEAMACYKENQDNDARLSTCKGYVLDYMRVLIDQKLENLATPLAVFDAMAVVIDAEEEAVKIFGFDPFSAILTEDDMFDLSAYASFVNRQHLDEIEFGDGEDNGDATEEDDKDFVNISVSGAPEAVKKFLESFKKE